MDSASTLAETTVATPVNKRLPEQEATTPIPKTSEKTKRYKTDTMKCRASVLAKESSMTPATSTMPTICLTMRPCSPTGPTPLSKKDFASVATTSRATTAAIRSRRKAGSNRSATQPPDLSGIGVPANQKQRAESTGEIAAVILSTASTSPSTKVMTMLRNADEKEQIAESIGFTLAWRVRR